MSDVRVPGIPRDALGYWVPDFELSMGGPDGSERVVRFYRCRDCYSLTADPLLHATWHEGSSGRNEDVYVVTTAKGFVESMSKETVEALLHLGLIEHDRDEHVLQDGSGNGVGPLYHFYVGRTSD